MSRDDHLEHLHTRGYTVLESVVPETLLGRIDAAVARLTEELLTTSPPAYNRFDHGQPRVLNLLAKDPVFAEVPLHEPVFTLIGRLLGDGCLLSSLASLPVTPGTPAQPLHSDDQANRVPRHPRMPTHATAIWMLDDFTADGGATRLVPGTHLRPEPADWTRPEDPALASAAVAVEAPRGSVLVYNGAVYHGAGANSTGSTRRALGVGYCAGFLRPNENQLLAVPAAMVRRFPRALAELCGYSIHAGMVGHVDGRDPYEVLMEGHDG